LDPLSIGMGVGALSGGLWANSQNLGESKRAREWSAVMAGSAWQRAAIDMKAAGFNPALAYMQGPASTPGAATASVQDAVGPAVSSAMHAKRLGEEVKLMRQQTAEKYITNTQMLPAQTALLKAQTREAGARTHAARVAAMEGTARTLATNVDRQLRSLEIPRATNAANVERGQLGRVAPYVERFIGLLPSIGLRRETTRRGASSTSLGVN